MVMKISDEDYLRQIEAMYVEQIAKVLRLKQALLQCVANAGNPDSEVACRLVIETAVNAIKEVE